MTKSGKQVFGPIICHREAEGLREVKNLPRLLKSSAEFSFDAGVFFRSFRDKPEIRTCYI